MKVGITIAAVVVIIVAVISWLLWVLLEVFVNCCDMESKVNKFIDESIEYRGTLDPSKCSTMGEAGLDSLDYIELIMDLEKEFHISLPDEKLEQWGMDKVEYVNIAQFKKNVYRTVMED